MRKRTPSFSMGGAAIVLLASMLAPGASEAATMREVSASGLVSGPQAGHPLEIASTYLRTRLSDLNVGTEDVSDMAISSWHTSSTDGVTHIYMRQRHQGIEVFDANLYFHILPDGSIMSVQSSLIGDLATLVPGTTPSLGADEAVRRVARDRGIAPPLTLSRKSGEQGPERATTFDGTGFARSDVPARLVYQRDEAGQLHLAWDLSIEALDGQHWWSVRIDARSGEIVEVDDWVDDATLRVFASPAESPSHSPAPPPADGRTVVINPEDPLASPTGWVAALCTEGPNVRAVYDPDDTETATNTTCVSAAGQPFTFAIDWTMQPYTGPTKDAAVVNLFYWNNVIHDTLWHRGFTRAAGNFEGGANRVFADAQDGHNLTPPARNNANFATPPNPGNPRMQMYLWDGPPEDLVFVQTPTPGGYLGVPASWPPTPGAAPQPNRPFVLVNDGTGASNSDACETPFVNAAAITGNIAVLDRGNCPFATKVANANAAGAVSIIVINNVAGDAPFTMGGTAPPGVTAPSVMISFEDGALLKAMIPGATGRVEDPPGTSVLLDGDFDSGIIAHEYGHGVSNRLVGGGAGGCLGGAGNCEQMGEGWSDLLGLVLTAKPTDTGPMRRGIGTYALSEPTTGGGIRDYPYSTDFLVSGFQHAELATGPCQAHSVGSRWAGIAWELYWALVNRDGFNADLKQTPPVAGNVKFLQYLIDGMKNTVCRPTFCDARNGILNAIQPGCGAATPANPNADCCLAWNAFARRGLGLNASCGVNTSVADNVAGSSVPTGCAAAPCAPLPGAVRNFLAAKSASDVSLRWNQEPLAAGGYHVYTADSSKLLIDDCRGTPAPPAGVTLALVTPPGAGNTTATDTGAIAGPPANAALLYYQVLATCTDMSEGPN